MGKIWGIMGSGLVDGRGNRGNYLTEKERTARKTEVTLWYLIFAYRHRFYHNFKPSSNTTLPNTIIWEGEAGGREGGREGGNEKG